MWDDIFLIPFLTGLCLALALPILGCFLRLRDEWLAALAYAHVAAAGALLALVGGIAPAIGGRECKLPDSTPTLQWLSGGYGQ